MRSSAVLACNLFDRWLENGQGAIDRPLSERIRRVELEAKLPTGLCGAPPALDLSLTGRGGNAVESKFAEPLASHPAGERFKGRLRTGQGLPRRRQLAERTQRDETGFSDAFQFLKHALGAKRNRPRGRLILLRFDAGERELDPAREIDEFAASTDDALGFGGVSRQEIFGRLAAEKGAMRDCVDRMRARYFPKRGP